MGSQVAGSKNALKKPSSPPGTIMAQDEEMMPQAQGGFISPMLGVGTSLGVGTKAPIGSPGSIPGQPDFQPERRRTNLPRLGGSFVAPGGISGDNFGSEIATKNVEIQTLKNKIKELEASLKPAATPVAPAAKAQAPTALAGKPRKEDYAGPRGALGPRARKRYQAALAKWQKQQKKASMISMA